LTVSTPAIVTGAAPATLLNVRPIESLEPTTADATHWKVVAVLVVVECVTFEILAAEAVLAIFVINNVSLEPLFSKLV
jgi:hypothetical protein